VVTDPPTNTARHKHTNPQTGPITIHCAAKIRTRRLEAETLSSRHRDRDDDEWGSYFVKL